MRQIKVVLAALLLGACASGAGGYGYSPNQAVGGVIGGGTGAFLCSFLGAGSGRVAASVGCGILGAAAGAAVGQTMDRVNTMGQPQPPVRQQSLSASPQYYYTPGDVCQWRYGNNAGAIAACRRGQEEEQRQKQYRLEQDAYERGRGYRLCC